MKNGVKIPREMRSAIKRIEREFERSEANNTWRLRVVPKLPNMVRIELFGKNVVKQRDIYPNQIAHVHKTLTYQ